MPYKRIEVSFAVDLYEEGYTDAEMAKKLGVTPSGVVDWRRRMGLPPNKKRDRRKLTPLERDAAEAKKRGMTYGQYKASQTIGTTEGQYKPGYKRKGKK